MGPKRLLFILENIVLFLVIFGATFSLPYNPDLGWHLRNGELVVQTKSVVQQDLFSHTLPGFGFVNHSWLTDVFLYSVYSRFGLLGIALLSSFILALTLLIPFTVFKVSTFSALFSLAAFWLLIRPDYRGFQAQFMSLFFLGLVFVVWQKSLTKKRRLWFLPFLFLFWSNFHGGAPVGLITLLILIGSRFLLVFRKGGFLKEFIFYSLVFLVCLVVTLLNPSGVKYWENFWLHLTDIVQREYKRRLSNRQGL